VPSYSRHAGIRPHADRPLISGPAKMITQQPANSVLTPIEDLLTLPSVHQLMEPRGKRTVADALAELDTMTPRYWSVREHMARTGQPECPLHVGPANVVLRSYGHMDLTVLAQDEELNSSWFGNGHRRLAIAVELGWSHIFTTPDVINSGAEYRNLQGKTPKVFPVTREEAEVLFPEASTRGRRWIDWATAQFEAAGWGHLIS
jgi:hypothetical protein